MRALITGVSRGIGRTLCLQLAADAIARGEKPNSTNGRMPMPSIASKSTSMYCQL